MYNYVLIYKKKFCRHSCTFVQQNGHLQMYNYIQTPNIIVHRTFMYMLPELLNLPEKGTSPEDKLN
jgi:hypothetical protein